MGLTVLQKTSIIQRDNAEYQRVHGENMLKLDKNKARRDHSEHQRVNREKMLKLDENKARRDNAEHPRIHREKMMKVNENTVKKLDVSRQCLSFSKRRVQDHQSLKNDQNSWQNKHRKIETFFDRLHTFKEATLYNAIFICTCCHQCMFKSNVRIFNKELEN